MKTKNGLVLIVIGILLIATSSIGSDSKKIRGNKQMAKEKGFAVIELFTSEGCSSCPPADQLVSKILNENKENVYILSFHVDYWNRLGWKDVFSQAAFSERQQLYASHLSFEGVYTPQIVVNGTEQFVGSDEDRLRASLSNNIKQPSTLTLEVTQTNKSDVHLVYNNANIGEFLNIAFVQPEAVTDVKRGENGGRKLHHVNIVREFKTIEASGSGNLDIKVAAEIRELPFKIIVYTQQKNSFKITGAAETAVAFNGNTHKKI